MSKRFGRNPKTKFIYNKELPTKGNKSERLVLPFSERLDNPKVGFSAYKYFSIMSKEKNFVATNAVCVKVTPAQQRLLQLLKGSEAADFADSLRTVHYNGTYGVPVDNYCPQSSRYTHLLLDAIQDIADRHEISKNQNS